MTAVERWTIAPPGGPAGPLYSIVTETGGVIALQIPDEATAKRLQALPQLEADLAAHKKAMRALVERAERVKDGEDWDLAEYILVKAEVLLAGITTQSERTAP